MKKLILALVAAVSLGSAAHAVTFTGTGSFSDDIDSTNPGIQAKAVVFSNTGPQGFVSSAFNFDLTNPGDSFTTDMFIVRTLASIAVADDYELSPFELMFDFGAAGAVYLGGNTYAQDFGSTTAGVMDFDGPVVIALGGGLGLVIEMTDVLFNSGALGTYTPGKAAGGTASVTFSLATIPLPASVLLLLAGIAGLGIAGRRRAMAV